MKKIKIFKHTDTNILENDINLWFEQNTNIDILDIKQSSTVNKWDSERLVITFIYVPKSKQQDIGPY